MKFYTVTEGKSVTHNQSLLDNGWKGKYGKEYKGGDRFPHEGINDQDFHRFSAFLDIHFDEPASQPIAEAIAPVPVEPVKDLWAEQQ